MNRQLLRLAQQAFRTRSKRSFAMLALVALIALGTWWFSDRGGEGSTTVVTEPSPSLVAEAGTATSTTTTRTPGTTASTEVTGPPSTEVPHSAVVASTDPAPTQPADEVPPATGAPTGIDANSGLPNVSLSDLPPEAAETLALIDDGGPYPYDRDGLTFGNFEGILPDEPRGYYREFTVETPGLSHRGARRIVVGDGGELYWTDDHYESFSVIVR